MLDIKIEGVESIQSDLDEFKTKVNRGINYGLKAFASELTPCLQRHIQSDVYETYEPKDYIRRHNHPQYGRSIFHSNNMEYHFLSGGNGVEFSYEPDGRNNLYPDSPYYTDGDSIISVIQQDKGYLWLKDGSIGKKRPFWDNFVKDVIHSGETWFESGFNQASADVQVKRDRDLIGQREDYALNPTFTATYPTGGGSDNSGDDDDLPF